MLTLACLLAGAARADDSLLTLGNGLVLRGEAEAVAGGWRLTRASGTSLVPAELVVAVADADEVEAAWRERRRALRHATPAERVPLAAWSLEVGLYRQALSELDSILEQAPDEPAALALLARDDLPVVVPALEPADLRGLPGLLDYAARSPAALQELAVARLGELPLGEQRGLPERLTAELSHADGNRRRFAALALRRLFPGLSLGALTCAALVDPSEPVRVQAALALADSGDEAVVDPLARALESDSSTLRTRAAAALGLVGQLAAVEPLALRLTTLSPSGRGGALVPRGTLFVGRQISYVQGFEAELASNAAIGDPLIGVVQEGVTLDARVFGTSGGGVSYTAETATLRRSLARLTGAEVGDSNAAWKRWWRGVGQEWVAAWRRAQLDQAASVECPSVAAVGG